MRHAAARFCRILGQSCLTQRAMAASSRSRARRSGRCTVQPIALRMRQICEGWWRTPVRRQITVWIRLQVHRSVSNPCASAPCSSARSILRRPRAVSLALRPGPVERRAARPPCCHAWYQRCVFWREVPSRWATSAWLVPCSNMRAARSRRRSIPLKSRGSLVGGWCAVVAAISPPLPQPGLLRGLWHTSVSPYSEKLFRSEIRGPAEEQERLEAPPGQGHLPPGHREWHSVGGRRCDRHDHPRSPWPPGPCIPRTRGGTSTFPGRNVVRQILAYRRAERWRRWMRKPITSRSSPAGHLIIEYGDYECPYSRQAFRAIEQTGRRLGGNVRFAFRHPDAVHRRGGAPRRLRPVHPAGGTGHFRVIRSRGAR